MLSPRGLGIALCAAFIVAAHVAHAAAEAPVHGAEIVIVNGIRIAVRRTQIVVPLNQAIAELQPSWGAPRAGLRGDRVVFGRQRGALHETLTLRPAAIAGQLLVLHAVQDLGQKARVLPEPPVHLRAGLRVVNAVQHGDSRTAPTTFTLRSALSTAAVLQALRAEAEKSGWQTVTAPAMRAGSGASWAERSGWLLTVVAQPLAAGGALVVLHVAPANGVSHK